MHPLALPYCDGAGRGCVTSGLLLPDLPHHEALQDEDEDAHEHADEPSLEAAER
jgi:hypothetical protein